MMSVISGLEFTVLRASGRDRAKFLHNFCTNNIRDLKPGTASEAFFTDVKARILAHGYVLALENVHEIWILPGDPQALLKHLTRYIITEDVTIELVSPPNVSVVVDCAPQVVSALRSELTGVPDQSLQCFAQDVFTEDQTSSGVSGLCFSWAGQLMISISGRPAFMDPLVSRLTEQDIKPVNADELNRRRIEERFPLIGQDMLSENLAPEAERNATAISYTKGCYLGQEPIARLDAMGHVNRALRIVDVEGTCLSDELAGSSLRTADGSAIGAITSACRVSPSILHGLSMVRLASASGTLHVLLTSGDQLPARVLPR